MQNTNGPLNSAETDGPTYEAIHPERPHVQRSRDSISTVASGDNTASSSEKYEKSLSNGGGGVNIARAQAEFEELNRELSRTSNLSKKISRVQSRQSRKHETIADIEKGPESEASSDEPFDLQTVLRGNRDEEEAAGIKSKRIGVVWENLTVSGIGGVKNYVKVSPVSSRSHIATEANASLRHSPTPLFPSSTSTKQSRQSLD